MGHDGGSYNHDAVDKRSQIVIVGMLDSIHVARWLEQFREQELDFFLFPSSPHRDLHPRLKSLMSGRFRASFKTFQLVRILGLPAWLLDKVLQNRLRGFLLKRVVRKTQPSVVHVLELQNAGYLVLQGLKLSLENRSFKLLLTNYGSDLFWFSRFPRHRRKLVQLLSKADFYSCECQRDVALARDLGFKGHVMPVFPNAGGFPDEAHDENWISAARRTSIAVKGYQGWVGRANVALDALELIADKVRELEIEIYSANRATIQRAKKLRRKTGLKVSYSPKKGLSHAQVLQLFGRAKVYVGISESDGISTSLLESMVCGAIPVQTSTACCEEWFTDSGVRVDTISADAVAAAILAALELSKDPSNAQKNRKTIAEKASEAKVKAAALQYYRQPLNNED